MSKTSTFSMFGGEGKTFTYNPVTGGTDGPNGSDPTGRGLYYSGHSTPIGGQPAGQNSDQEPTEQSIGRIRSLRQNSGQGGEWSGYVQAAQQQPRGGQMSYAVQGGQQEASATDQSAERIRQAQQARAPHAQAILLKQESLTAKRAELIGIGYSPDEADALLADQTRQAQQAYEESQRQKRLEEQRNQANYDEAQRQKRLQEQRNQAFYEEQERQKQLKWKNEQASTILGWPDSRGYKRAKLIGLGYSPDEADALLGPAT